MKDSFQEWDSRAILGSDQCVVDCEWAKVPPHQAVRSEAESLLSMYVEVQAGNRSVDDIFLNLNEVVVGVGHPE